jgi:hypothetical protein
MSLGKLIAGAVLTVGIIKIAQSPEARRAIQGAIDHRPARTSAQTTSHRGGGELETIATTREEMMRHGGGAPEIRIGRSTGGQRTDAAVAYTRAKDAYTRLVNAMNRYGRNSRQAAEAHRAYQAADAAYRTSLAR